MRVTNDTHTALVIGGGIAGPVAAMALRQAGIDATVYEAYDSGADGVGGGLGIAPNGQDALAAIGLGDLVPRLGVPMRAYVLENGSGRRLAEFGAPENLPVTRFVWRADLYRALYDEAARRGVRIVHGKRLVDAVGGDDGSGGVTARFADGTTASGDVLVGADGIRSVVRKQIDPGAPTPRYAGLQGFGGRLSATGLPSTHGRMHMVFGRRAFFGYQVEDDGSGGWFANLPRRAPMTLAEVRAVGNEEWLRVLREAFDDDRVPAVSLIGRVDPADLVVTGPMEDIPSVPTWRRGRMVLIGDAAHPTSPSSGQGASLAMESAVQLARCLRDLPRAEAFAAYEQLRRARCERIIAMAARTNSDKAAGPVGRVLRDLIMPVAVKLAKPERWTWQFDHHIDWDAPVDAAPVPTGR